jgi:hypothetical protein
MHTLQQADCWRSHVRNLGGDFAWMLACLKAEGVSLNTLVVTFIAEGLGRKERRA